jgi:hypothetical protein
MQKYHKFKLFHIPDNASIFTAESKAIDLALPYILQHYYNKFAIVSGSPSMLLLIKKSNIRLHNDNETLHAVS